MPDGLAKVVIVGAGFGGIEAVKSLSRSTVEVTVIDRQNHHCFQPLLYQVATADVAAICQCESLLERQARGDQHVAANSVDRGFSFGHLSLALLQESNAPQKNARVAPRSLTLVSFRLSCGRGVNWGRAMIRIILDTGLFSCMGAFIAEIVVPAATFIS